MSTKWKQIEELMNESREILEPYIGNKPCDVAEKHKAYELASKKIDQAYEILTGKPYKPNP